MNSREEIAKKYFPCTCGEIYLSRNLTAPDCPFHAFDWDGAFEEYAQQSQPSGMSAEEVKEIAENHFKNTTWLEGTQEQDTKFGFRIGYMKAMKDFTIQNPSTASPAGAAEGASEGISKIREVMNWISQCVDEDHDLEVSEIKMIWNDLSDAISLIESTPHSSEGMAEALRECINHGAFTFYCNTNNCICCSECKMPLTQSEFKEKLASLSPGVEDGSGWVSLVDKLPDYGTIDVWVSEYHHKGRMPNVEYRKRDFHNKSDRFEAYMHTDSGMQWVDITNMVTHWRPLPAPPGE